MCKNKSRPMNTSYQGLLFIGAAPNYECVSSDSVITILSAILAILA